MVEAPLGTVLADALAGKPGPTPGYNPHPMSKPMVLYRSVSVPELIDIWRSGVITGGRNVFNPFDERGDVFFADTIDDRLIRQGEYVDRQVTFALKNHAITTRSEQIGVQMERQANRILAELDRDGIRYNRDNAEYLGLGLGHDRRKMRAAAFRGPRAAHGKYARLFRDLARLTRESGTLATEYDRMYQEAFAERLRWLGDLPFSSAILVTRPVTGGLIYAADRGWCGHGEREYGFAPGHLTFADVAEIIFIKACHEVDRCCPADLASRLGDVEGLGGVCW